MLWFEPHATCKTWCDIDWTCSNPCMSGRTSDLYLLDTCLLFIGVHSMHILILFVSIWYMPELCLYLFDTCPNLLCICAIPCCILCDICLIDNLCYVTTCSSGYGWFLFCLSGVGCETRYGDTYLLNIPASVWIIWKVKQLVWITRLADYCRVRHSLQLVYPFVCLDSLVW